MLKFTVLPWNFKSNPILFTRASTFKDEDWNTLLSEVNSDNGIILSTCNRTEVYFSVSEAELDSLKARFPETLTGDEAIRHVFRVAAGLESMSIGENEILGQLSDAFERSLEKKMSNKLVSLILRRAISTGKRIRRETQISRGKTSISAIAVERASRIMDITNSAVSVIGTGKMAEQFLKYLLKYKPEDLSIVGRNADRLSFLFREYGAVPHHFDELPDVISSADITFVATSSKSIIIHGSYIDTTRKTRQIFVDISHPRNVDQGIAEINGREIVSLEDITREVNQNLSKKGNEIRKAEIIIDESLTALHSKLKELQVEDLIEKSYKHLEGIARTEVDRMLAEIKKGNDSNVIKEAMVKSMIDKMLSSYIQTLKKAADSDDAGTLKIFELTFAT